MMRALVLSGCGLVVASCGTEPEPCTVKDLGNGQHELTCPDGTKATIENGIDGDDGTDNRITTTFLCVGELVGSGGFWFKYRAAVLASGDVFAFGAIQAASLDSGGSVFYSAQQAGAATAAVIFTADIAGAANGGWWRMQADRTSRVAVLEYSDVDVSGGQDIWTMPAASCAVQAY